MEDHCDAYPAWKQLEVSAGVCVHLDAHLDLSDEGFSPDSLRGILSCRSAGELEAFRSNPRLPWGGFHAGNYLYPAVLDNTVRHIYWVVPPWLNRGRDLLEWTRDELQNWYDVPLDDYRSLHQSGGRVEGQILGRPFTLCRVEDLPRFDQPVLLDIDVDYFLDADDTIFETPDVILDVLRGRNVVPRSTTISYSVNGGYLPLEHRYVGDAVEALAAGTSTAAELEGMRHAVAGDRLRVRGDLAGAVASYEKALGCGVFEPSFSFKMHLALREMGREDEARRLFARAAELDEHYRPRALDIAFVHFRRRAHALCLEWLEVARRESPEDAPLTWYVEGLTHMRAQDMRKAIAAWDRLVDEPSFRPPEQAYLCMVLGRALYREGQTARAMELLRRSVSVDPANALYHQHLGTALRQEGRLEEAARHLRKSISLDDKRLSVLEAHRTLVEVYEASGHRAMADAEARRLAQKDVLGTSSLDALLRVRRR